MTSLVTVHNSKQLLQELRYVSVGEARQSLVPSQPVGEVTIEHCFQVGNVFAGNVKYLQFKNVVVGIPG